jgi:roadblock/LC7 domain-containing protein
MLRQLLAVDGVMAIAQFRDDGVLVEGYGMGGEDMLQRLSKFAHDYKRLVQGNAGSCAAKPGVFAVSLTSCVLLICERPASIQLCMH